MKSKLSNNRNFKINEEVKKDKESKERDNIIHGGCCIINNKNLIFNVIEDDGYIQYTFMLDYAMSKNDEPNILKNKVYILKELRNYCIRDKEYLSMLYQNYNYWTIKYDNKYIFFDGNKINFCDYPAFFVKIQCDKTLGGFFETINVYSSIMTVFSTVRPFFEKIDIDMKKISCEPCFEHSNLYSDEKKAFELLFNIEYKDEYRFEDESKFIDNFDFKIFHY